MYLVVNHFISFSFFIKSCSGMSVLILKFQLIFGINISNTGFCPGKLLRKTTNKKWLECVRMWLSSPVDTFHVCGSPWVWSLVSQREKKEKMICTSRSVTYNASVKNYLLYLPRSLTFYLVIDYTNLSVRWHFIYHFCRWYFKYNIVA